MADADRAHYWLEDLTSEQAAELCKDPRNTVQSREDGGILISQEVVDEWTAGCERSLNEQQNRVAFRDAQIEMEIHAALFALRYRGLKPPPLTERQRGTDKHRW